MLFALFSIFKLPIFHCFICTNHSISPKTSRFYITENMSLSRSLKISLYGKSREAKYTYLQNHHVFTYDYYVSWRRQWHPTLVLLPTKSHGWRSLVQATVHGVAELARLSDFTFTFHLDALEKEMTTHSSVLAWRIPGTGEPGGLPSMGSHRVRHD